MSMLLAYDASGNVVATLDYLVIRNPDGSVAGLADFDAHEKAGGENTDIWTCSEAVGSKVWPEWLGARAHDFKVELVGPAGQKRIAALVHKSSGYRRSRAAVASAIVERIAAAAGEPADIRDLVGGPSRPITIDETGATLSLSALPSSLPVIPVEVKP